MKKTDVILGSILLGAILFFMGCPLELEEEKDTAVTFIGLTADGSASATTTRVTLIFDDNITKLEEGDITITPGSTGTTKGILTRTGAGIYELTVSDITASGQITIAVTKTGYAIKPAAKTVTVYYYIVPDDAPVTFSGLTADGSASATTTKVALTFDKDIAGLEEEDITITAGSTGTAKGILTRTGTGTYELMVSDITAGGQITVAVAKTGYAISPATKAITVYYYIVPGSTLVTFSGLTSDGSASATTTKVTLTFDKDITGLEAGDIMITPGSTGTAQGTLTRTGIGVYELTVNGIAAGGQIIVAVVKTGYAISPASKNVTVFYYAPVASVSLNKNEAGFLVGETEQLSATVLPVNANDKTLTWQSSNTAVATVSTDGLVTALAAGTTVITATANDGSGKLANCTVIVTTTLPQTLSAALLWLASNAKDGASYTIGLNENEYIDRTNLSYGEKNVTINLQGNDTERIVIPTIGYGYLFTIRKGVTLVLKSNITLQGRNDNNMALIDISSEGVFIMEGNSKINDNKRGGVSVSDRGTFIMSGGEISGNKGGGVSVSVRGTFTMNGGEISGNTSSYGGGVSVSDRGTFTMNGGEINGNTSSAGIHLSGGGGVYVSGGTFTMSNGEISGNTSSNSYGGGVSVSGGGFTMSGGEISGNTSSYGGGVSVSGGGFTMSGGEISGNTSSYGGGVYVSGGGLIMRGGKISGNTSSSSSSYGGGVYVGSGTFTMSSGEISGNTASSSSLFSSSGPSYGGGVCVNGGIFQKIPFGDSNVSGIIYGSDAEIGLKNTVSGGSPGPDGHAVYLNSTKKRNTTAGENVRMDSGIDGIMGGWE
jgi:hypothetical protein